MICMRHTTSCIIFRNHLAVALTFGGGLLFALRTPTLARW